MLPNIKMFKAAVSFLLIVNFVNVNLELVDKFNVEITENVKNCMDSPLVDFSEFRVIIKDKDVLGEGKIKITKTIDGPIKMAVIAETKKDGMWKTVTNGTIRDACVIFADVKTMEPLYKFLPEAQRECPLEKGDVSFKDAKFATLQYISGRDLGEHRWNVRLLKQIESDEQEVACIRGSVRITEN